MASINKNSMQIASGNEGLNCFVCDSVVVGMYFTLASCRTQKSKVRLIEKLGQLVGDQYMVVISEDDVICRTCTSMMNNLDRLEREMASVRTILLRFLEKKYDLDEGELLSTKITLPVLHRPNISNLKNVSDISCGRKRKASALEEDEIEFVDDDQNDKNKKTIKWLQCDKCKYKTPYNTFMVNHIQRHSPQNNNSSTNEKEKLNNVETTAILDSVSTAPNEVEQEAETKTEYENNINGASENENKSEPETVEMIAAEIQDLGAKVDKDTIDEKVISTLNLVQDLNPKQELVDGQQQIATLEVEGEESILDTNNAICMVDENGMILQKMEQAEDGTYYMQVMEGDTTKQVLSVNEDGTIQMVEVMWDDIGTSTVSEDDNIPF